jgi:hypothetical protein
MVTSGCYDNKIKNKLIMQKLYEIIHKITKHHCTDKEMSEIANVVVNPFFQTYSPVVEQHILDRGFKLIEKPDLFLIDELSNFVYKTDFGHTLIYNYKMKLLSLSSPNSETLIFNSYICSYLAFDIIMSSFQLYICER